MQVACINSWPELVLLEKNLLHINSHLKSGLSFSLLRQFHEVHYTDNLHFGFLVTEQLSKQIIFTIWASIFTKAFLYYIFSPYIYRNSLFPSPASRKRCDFWKQAFWGIALILICQDKLLVLCARRTGLANSGWNYWVESCKGRGMRMNLC